MRLTQRTSTWIPTLILLSAPAVGQTTRALTLRAPGAQSDGNSACTEDILQDFTFYGCSISNDGRYVLFQSSADNLVPGDTNGADDIFMRDSLTGAVTRISVDANGAQANGASYYPTMSQDGRYVAFLSGASNLAPNDTANPWDIFVKDLQTGAVVLASVSSSGAQVNDLCTTPVISGNGRYVVFVSNATNLVPLGGAPHGHVFVRDLQAGTTSIVDVSSTGDIGNNATYDNYWPSISADGRYIAFASAASNLVPGDTDNDWDGFLRDTVTGTTVRIAQSAYDISLSANGRYFAYDTNGAGVHVYDLQTATDTAVSYDFNGAFLPGAGTPAISPDGRWVSFLLYTQQRYQIYARDLQAGQTFAISHDLPDVNWGNGDSIVQWNMPAFSGDDRRLVFFSGATNIVAGDTNGVFDVFVADLQNGGNTRVSVSGAGFMANGDSNFPSASSDGRWVAFESVASDLVLGDTNGVGDVFVCDVQTGSITCASVSSAGVQGNYVSYTSASHALSADGRLVVFDSVASNFVPGDTNDDWDVFVRDLQAGTTTCASVSSGGLHGNGASQMSAISAAGGHVVFASDATNLVAGDTNNSTDVFVRDLHAGTTIRASVDSAGVQGNGMSGYSSISSDGRLVVFESYASNLVPGDTNGSCDIFLHDLQTGLTTRISTDSSGAQGNGTSRLPVISADGRIVVYVSDSTNLVAGDTNNMADVFVRDLQSGVTSRVSVSSAGGQSNGQSYRPTISSDGRYVSFASYADNLVSGDFNQASDVFLHDRLTGTTTLISISSTGVEGDGDSAISSMPGDGRWVVFGTLASNLGSGVTNGNSNILLRDRGSDAIFAPFCFGDGTTFACPCGNSGLSGRGCQNSAGTGGAVLSGSGVPSLAADTVHLISSYELPSVTSILLQGSAIASPTIFGDGRRCAGGTVKRLYSVSAVAGVATAPGGSQVSISARSAAMGSPISAGSTRIYQMYYRDPSASFCPNPPGNLYNISSAVAITWTN